MIAEGASLGSLKFILSSDTLDATEALKQSLLDTLSRICLENSDQAKLPVVICATCFWHDIESEPSGIIFGKFILGP